MSGCVVVAGMHRSGTSLVAGMMAAGGCHMGEFFVPADRANPEGYFEDRDIVRFHQHYFTQLLSGQSGGHADWGWVPGAAVPADGLPAWSVPAAELIRTRQARGGRWGFKDPRATLMLDFWDRLLPTPVYVAVYRRPTAVADSMQRLRAPQFLSDPQLPWIFWELYNRRLLEFVRRHRRRCLLLNVEALARAPESIARLAGTRLGLDLGIVAGRHFRPELLGGRQATPFGEDLVRGVWAECAAVYEELEREADLPDGTEEPRRPASPPHSALPWSSLSVVISTYNDAGYLVEALTSVRRYVDPRAEVLICDDGSTDPACHRILERLEALGYRILRQSNAGLPTTRNRLIREAKGSLILPLDADNRLLPGFLEQALHAFRDDPKLGVFYGDRRVFGAQEEVVVVPPFDVLAILRGNTIDACAVFRREAWAEVGGYDPRFICHEDWEFWLHLGRRGWKFRHSQGLSFEYRVRPGSLLARANTQAWQLQFRRLVMRKHPDLLAAALPERLRRLTRQPAPQPGRAVPPAGVWARTLGRLYWRWHFRSLWYQCVRRSLSRRWRGWLNRTTAPPNDLLPPSASRTNDPFRAGGVAGHPLR